MSANTNDRSWIKKKFIRWIKKQKPNHFQAKINHEILNSKVFNLENQGYYGNFKKQRGGTQAGTTRNRYKSSASAKARSKMNIHNNEAGRRVCLTINIDMCIEFKRCLHVILFININILYVHRQWLINLGLLANATEYLVHVRWSHVGNNWRRFVKLVSWTFYIRCNRIRFQ